MTNEHFEKAAGPGMGKPEIMLYSTTGLSFINKPYRLLFDGIQIL
jgi:hypothetical protein